MLKMKLLNLLLISLALFAKCSHAQFFSSIMDFLIRGQRHVNLEQIDETKGRQKTEFDFISMFSQFLNSILPS